MKLEFIVTTPAWTQDEAINFECARDAISHLMACYTAEIEAEGIKEIPDSSRIIALTQYRSALADERERLSVSHHEQIARIIKDCNQKARESKSRQQV